uniref:MobQ family relaxase n=1 Tax=Polaromonas sp. TaxID=1869339 RepID=UPI0015EFAEF3|nr:MobQ family relaxase [Polaromonas sp.]
MAIFHLTVKVFSRSKQHSAVAAASYRAGIELVDARDGVIHDYRKRGGVDREACALILPAGAPAWDRQRLWDEVEKAETRKNSCVAREVEVSLPTELPGDVRASLAKDFTRWLVAKYGFAAQVDIHEPTRKNDDRNHHAHILTSTRALNADGFGAKCRVLDAAKTGSEEILTWRAEWARRVNAALELKGFAARVDHRSNEARSIEELPTIHVGRGPASVEREGLNEAVTVFNTDLRKLLTERAQAVSAEFVEDAARQAQQDAEAAIAAGMAATEHIASEQPDDQVQAALTARQFVQAVDLPLQLEKVERRLAKSQAASSQFLEKLTRARPRAEIEQARQAADALKIEYAAQSKAVVALQAQAAELPAWRWMTGRRLARQIAEAQAQQALRNEQWREAVQTSRLPGREDALDAVKAEAVRRKALEAKKARLEEEFQALPEDVKCQAMFHPETRSERLPLKDDDSDAKK